MSIVKEKYVPLTSMVVGMLSIMLLTSGSAHASLQKYVFFDVTVWTFTPTRPDGFNPIHHSLDAHPGDEFGDSGGQMVISAEKSARVADTFRQSGTLKPLLHWHAESMPGESLPIATTSSTGTLSAVFKIDEVPSSGGAWNPSSQAILSFTLKADLPGSSSSGIDTLANSGRVLLQNGGALLNINRMDKSYLVWLVHVTDEEKKG